MWSTMGLRAVLADAQGKVVVDSTGEWNGRTLPASSLEGATPVQANGRIVGWLIAASLGARAAGSPAGDFLDSVNRSILLVALLSGSIALVLGFLLFRQITSPLGVLTDAAQRIASGELGHRVPVHHDDEIGRLGRAFNAMADDLARQEEIRRNLLADVAHELRNPIGIIQGELEAMMDGLVPLGPESIAAVHEETVLLGRLVGDLRTLSLAGVGQLKPKMDRVDPVELARSVVERGRGQAQEKGVTLGLDAPIPVHEVWADVGQIAQVIRNLLSNAALHAGGRARHGSGACREWLGRGQRRRQRDEGRTRRAALPL